MSKATENGVTSVTCGFFNSMVTEDSAGNKISDRKYDAEQMSAIFDGLINDGVFASIGDALVVRANADATKTSSTDGKVYVGTGKCWFNHTWTCNDSLLPIQCEKAEALQTRIDAIVIEVNTTPAVRDNFIKYVKGTASQSNPSKPTLTNDDLVHQHALCYITRKPGSENTISDADIENCVGTDKETPFVTGIVDVLDLQTILKQWSAQLDNFIADGEQEMTEFKNKEQAEYDALKTSMKQLMTDVANDLTTWNATEKVEVLNWFNEIKGQLSDDPALNLQLQIDADEIERLLMEGLPDGTKTFSDDGTVVTSTDSAGRTLTKTFTDNFLTITSVLKSTVYADYLKYPYSGIDSGKSKTVNGITFTDNGDGTITASGTATANASLVLSSSTFKLPPGVYGITGCPSGGSDSTYYVRVALYNGSDYVNGASDFGTGGALDTNDATYTESRVYILISSGVTVTNLTFNPKVFSNGATLGTLVKEISADGKTINSTLTNYSDTVPNLVEIERGIDAIIASENSYIGEEVTPDEDGDNI